MIASGLKKLAAAHNMRVSHGVAYGSLCGYAATLSEGAGFKQIYLTTKFPDSYQQYQLQQQLDSQMLEKEFRVQEITFSSNLIHIKFLDNPGTMKKSMRLSTGSFRFWIHTVLHASISARNVDVKSPIAIVMSISHISGCARMCRDHEEARSYINIVFAFFHVLSQSEKQSAISVGQLPTWP